VAKYKDWLKTFYAHNNKGKEILWGKVMDITIKDEIPIAIVYFSGNPIGYKIIPILFNKITKYAEDGQIWSPRKTS